MPAPDPIGLEITAIEREDPPCAKRFSGYRQGSIRQIHRVIRVVFHQFEGSLYSALAQEPNLKPAFGNKFAKIPGTQPSWSKDVKKPRSIQVLS
jgi:hypothetical protein